MLGIELAPLSEDEDETDGQCQMYVTPTHGRAYSKRVPHTNCALRIKKCAPRISSGIYFFKHKLINK